MPREIARKVLEIESQAILELLSRIDDAFDRAVEILYACTGRVVVTGMGKSGIIGQKISATFSSTGTPSLFLHPAEAVHGDLGRIVMATRCWPSRTAATPRRFSPCSRRSSGWAPRSCP